MKGRQQSGDLMGVLPYPQKPPAKPADKKDDKKDDKKPKAPPNWAGFMPAVPNPMLPPRNLPMVPGAPFIPPMMPYPAPPPGVSIHVDDRPPQSTS